MDFWGNVCLSNVQEHHLFNPYNSNYVILYLNVLVIDLTIVNIDYFFSSSVWSILQSCDDYLDILEVDIILIEKIEKKLIFDYL